MKMLAKVLAAAWRVIAFLLDWCIDVMVAVRKGERAVKPTDRVPWTKELKERLGEAQNRTCMYCGERKLLRNLQIDHMYPVVRGGSNGEWNLQLLCAPCNRRKGIQTDGEFRERYSELVDENSTSPPTEQISQSEFRRVTRQTTQSSAVREFRRSRYVSPARKVTRWSVAAGSAFGLIILLGLALVFPNAGYLPLIAAICFGGTLALTFILRARATGKMEDE